MFNYIWVFFLVLLIIILHFVCCHNLNFGNIADWVSALITLFAVFAALFRDEIHGYFCKPEIKYFDVITNQQNHGLFYRLPIKNVGDGTMRGIQYSIIECSNGVNNNNLIPAPMNWTHCKKSVGCLINILPLQTAYLDILIFKDDPSNPSLKIQSNVISDQSTMVDLNEGTSLLRLKYFSKNGLTGNVTLEVEWDKSNGKKPIVKIMRGE